MEEEGRNTLAVDEILAVTPPDSIGSGFVPMGGSSVTAGFESAYSDNEDGGGPSPVDTNSFHTASSIEGSNEHLEIVPLHSNEVSPSPPPPPPPESRVYNLPTGFESQPKLELNEESVRPTEKEPLPDDSIFERISRARDSTSYEQHRRRPSIDVPNEATPLITQNSYRSSDEEDLNTSCCVII